MPAIALYQPDIPQNTGTILRLGACLGLAVHVIGPAGFDMSGPALRRAALDYLDASTLVRHTHWEAFRTWPHHAGARLVLFSTRAETSYTDFTFRADDVLLFGRESAGVPDPVHAAADARLRIPIGRGMRSLNVAMAVAMATGEALRQSGAFTEPGDQLP